MILEKLLSHLREAIAANHIDEVFALLAEYVSPETKVYQQYLAFSARWNDVYERALMGVVDTGEESLEKNKILKGLISIIDRLKSKHLKDPDAGSPAYANLPIQVICRDEADRHHMRDFFSRLDFRAVSYVIADRFQAPPPEIQILIFANHSLKTIRVEKQVSYDEAGKQRLTLMKTYLEYLETSKRFTFAIHFGGYWAERDNWLEWLHAANTKFALYARLREMAEFMTTYRKEGEYV